MGKPATRTKPAKLPPVRVASDECAVTAGGATYHPHAGEWVEFRPVIRVEQMQRMLKLMRVDTELKALAGEPDEALRSAEALAGCLTEMGDFLAGRLVGWNWTDNDGEPYPPPTADVLRQLGGAELFWLFRAGQGEQPEERKND